MTQKFTDQLHRCLIDAMTKEGLWSDDLLSDLPKRGIWGVYDDLILFPNDAFMSKLWRVPGTRIWEALAAAFGGTRVARIIGVIQNDAFRSPQIEILLPGNGSTLVRLRENGIKFQWDILKSMFSSGNMSEKLRISRWDCSDQVVVDMYAGIGYFALSYLVHARAKQLYAIEWNPAAVEALRNNLIFNEVADRCIVIEGDNRLSTPEDVADHVNLGLIPSSQNGWIAACRALKRTTGGVLHIHGSCDTKNPFDYMTLEDQKLYAGVSKAKVAHSVWAGLVQAEINEILPQECGGKWKTEKNWIQKVKSYAPNVDHVVLDLTCTPVTNDKVKVPNPIPMRSDSVESDGASGKKEMMFGYNLDQLIEDLIEVTKNRMNGSDSGPSTSNS